MRTPRHLASLAACGLAAAGLGTVGAATSARAATPTVLYASPSGSGTTCSQTVPCSISSAKSRVEQLNANQAADIDVNLSGGSYHVPGGLQLGPADSGRNGYHVIWQAVSGQVPLISGADKITGFTQYNAGLNIWRAPLSAADAAAGGQQLFVNGQRAQLARSSGSPAGTAVISTGFKTTNGSYASFTNQNRIEVVQDNDWKHMSCPVQSITAVSGGADINVLPSCWSANHTHVPNLGFPYNGSGLPSMSGITYVENAYQLLTQPGQFYVDNSAHYLYYIPRSGQNLATADVELPVDQNLLTLQGTPGHLGAGQSYSGTITPVRNVTFQGIDFEYSTWNLPVTTGYIDNQAGVLWNVSNGSTTPLITPAAVTVSRGAGITFTGDAFEHLGAAAVALSDGTQSSAVSNSTITDTAGGGVSVGEVDDFAQSNSALWTSGDTVSNNTISYVGQNYTDTVGVWVGYTRNVTITHNTVSNTPYSGMSIGWGWGYASPCSEQYAQGLRTCVHGTNYAGGNQVTDNYVHNVMNVLYDGGPIYTNGGQGDTGAGVYSILSGNYVTNGGHDNNMLYQDEGSSFWHTYNNVVSNAGGGTWIGMWTPTCNNIIIGPANYSSTSSVNNRGTNISYTPPTVVTNGQWPSAAVSIMNSAGAGK